MVVAFHFTDSPNAYFAAVLGLTISTTTIGYLAIFPALIVLRYKLPDAPRPYRVPLAPRARGSAAPPPRFGPCSPPSR